MLSGQTHLILQAMDDHRVNRTKAHSMENIIFIAMAAVVCGCQTWNEIEEFGNDRIEWFGKHLNLVNGIPSHDTFNRFFSAMDTDKFEECFRSWANSVVQGQLETIHIDGKTIRGSRTSKNSALHMVSAWSSENKISLGQVRTSEKSNEITAIPELLDALFVSGSVITIDAMGCQKEIVKSIIENDADYVIAVKKNQKNLFNAIDLTFGNSSETKSFIKSDTGHGRIESRIVHASSDLLDIPMIGDWVGLKSAVALYSVRNGQEVCQYFITSLDPDAERLSKIIRNHWSIENNLHWQLDVSFNEDGTRKRNVSANQNFSLLNKIALHMLTKEESVKMGVKSKRLKAGWNPSYLESVLGI